MKYSVPLITSLLCLTSLSAVQKKQTMPSSNLEESTTQPNRVITPAVAPIVNGGANLIVSADFIWWKTIISNLEYAVSGIHDSTITADQSVTKGHLKSPKFRFEPGFKVGLGVLTNHDGWDIDVQYTWLRGKKHKNSIDAIPGQGLDTSFSDVGRGGGVAPDHALLFATAQLKQHFTVLDSELGRNFFISHRLTLRPYSGLKFGWIDEKFHIDYSLMPNPFTYKLKQKMFGVGIRTGLDTVWHFNKHLGIYADLAITGLWSFLEDRCKQTLTDTTTNIPVITLNTKEKLQGIINVFEFGLGLTYMQWLSQDRYQIFVKAGWEEQLWNSFNNFVDAVILRSGNLSIQGLTVKAGFNF